MSKRVLVVDDSGTMRKIIIRSLNAVGISEITEAADGNDALVRFGQGEFDLVLTDWNMPNKNGLELVKELRKASAIPVIMITTEAEKQRVVEAIGAGVTDYLVKPFTSDALRDKLAPYGN